MDGFGGRKTSKQPGKYSKELLLLSLKSVKKTLIDHVNIY